VIYNGMPVAGSPFTSKAFNVAAIAVSPVGVGMVGVPAEFSSKFLFFNKISINGPGFT
jgi:hypothetical protein